LVAVRNMATAVANMTHFESRLFIVLVSPL
jgi:hypothetical protein